MMPAAVPIMHCSSCWPLPDSS